MGGGGLNEKFILYRMDEPFLNFVPILVLFCPKLCSDFKDNVPQYLSLFNGYFGGALKDFGSCDNSG